ncbi:MAG TPA: YidC/Oxa1 family membrane protein insertase [Actinomycetota bacterium]|nr:YidC/Oxa1 family membrane protein insertase [Actinomycetota bacterium]
MIAVAWWQSILSAFGSVLSFLYEIVANYGLAIVLLTLLVRVILLPLTIKQTRSMQEMQRVQPLVKELQKKYKGDRQKLNEEMMKLYREHRVNPLGGCLPLLLQFPVFIALYSVLRGDPKLAAAKFAGRFTGQILPSIAHLPVGSSLATAIQNGKAGFLGMNLSCAPLQAGKGSFAIVQGGAKVLNCGTTWPAAIPFFVMVALMVLTTWYQQRQMQAMSGQSNPQMRLMGRIMPVFLGFISLQIPAGVLLYWVTTNFWQVGQQTVMLRMRAREGGAPLPARRDGRADGRGDGKPGGPSGKPAGRPAPKAAPGRPKQPPSPTPLPPGELSRRSSPGVTRSRSGSRKKRRKR